ncbi:MAG: site-specific integrase [Clostridia bacterium]|nr:site-specific integrase [Clostridia bacterium]
MEQVKKGMVVNRKIRFEEAFDEWIAFAGEMNIITHASAKRYKTCRPRLVEELGHYYLSDLRKKDIQAFIKKIGTGDKKNKGASEKSQKNYKTVISNIYKYAVDNEYVFDNPCKDIKIVKKETKPRQIYSVEEVQTILNLMADEPLKYFLFHILAFFCGFRRGELLGIEWGDISFEERKIKIRRASLYANDIGTYTSTPKTVGSRRTVVVSGDVIDLLKRYKAEQDEYKKMLGDAWIDNDRLFTQWNGAPMGTSTPLNWYREFCKKNNIRYLCTHCCRHFNISLMIKNHVDVVSVSAAAGHKDITTTLNIYAEEFEEANAASVETVSSCISIPSVTKTTEE